MAFKVAVIAGDGIGPEVTEQAVRVLRHVRADIEFEHALVGGAAYDATGHPLPTQTLDLCRSADAVLLGAVGGPKWDQIPDPKLRPEVGALLPLRSELNLYANVRPAKAFKALVDSSPVKLGPNGIDLIVMRELTGGIYFGQPRERRDNGNLALDSMVYHRSEVERITERAIEVARTRSKRIVSVDKANVLETSRLWREVVDEMAKANSDISVSHMLVDNCAMQLVRDPGQFDVILTENMFGDILSDEAAMITGSLGLLPSASLSDPKEGTVFGMYEPIHGSAPDIAGQNCANPIAAIMSAAMLLQYTCEDTASAQRIEMAIERVLDSGVRTADIGGGASAVGTREMGDAIIAELG
ncbi:MAG: 3-isopropylmalate dehydrogenase [Chthonomonas sp.]|nr:3-isopropylmalate dehydrogenase [Chthonomonas sp.]